MRLVISRAPHVITKAFGMAYQHDTQTLKNDHVRIYRRRPGGRFHARITVPNEPGFNKKFALDTLDPAEARDRALEQFQEYIFRQRNNMPVQPKTVANAIDAYLEEQTRKQSRGEITYGTLYNQKLFLAPWKRHIGSKLVHQVSKIDVDKFDSWRAYEVFKDKADGKAKFRKAALSSKAKRNYLTTFKAVLTYAVSLGWTSSDKIPAMKCKLGKERRPSFEPEHLAQIRQNLSNWEKSAKDSRQVRVWPQYRIFFSFMLNTGLRLGEARRLQWKHVQRRVSEGKTYDVIVVPKGTKTGARESVPLLGTGLHLDELRSLYQHVWGFVPTPDDYVFCDLKRGMRKKFDHVMRKILDRGCITRDSNGSHYTIYSTRHTYATERLLSGDGEIYMLAKNMGTSVQMIERHYGHVKPIQAAAQLAANNSLTAQELQMISDRCGLISPPEETHTDP